MNASTPRGARALDAFDRAILRILQQDNHAPHRLIGEAVNLSAAAVQRRIAAMEAAGVIAGNVAVLDPAAFQPMITVVVEVHLTHDRTALVEAAKARFSAAPEVQQCYYVTGGAGFILVVLTPDMAAFTAFAKRLFADSDDVQTYRTLVVHERVKVGLELPV